MALHGSLPYMALTFQIVLPRVRSTCGRGFELKFLRVPVAAWAVASYSNSQPATGIPQIIDSKPIAQTDLTRGRFNSSKVRGC